MALSNWQKNLSPCETSVSIPGAFSGGKSAMQFSAPGAGNNGSVDFTVKLSVSAAGTTCVNGAAAPVSGAAQSWLRGQWSGNQYDQDPTGRATFGVYKGDNPIIYLRENY